MTLEISDLKRLKLDVLKQSINDYCDPTTAGVFKGMIEEHLLLLTVATTLLNTVDWQKQVSDDRYDQWVRSHWSALRQLVCLDQ